MADFRAIREKINREIKQNGNGDITGAVLNDVLDSMVDAVDQVKMDTNGLYGFLGFPIFDPDSHYEQDSVAVYNGGLFLFIRSHDGEWDFDDVVPTTLYQILLQF